MQVLIVEVSRADGTGWHVVRASREGRAAFRIVGEASRWLLAAMACYDW
jgi:hypothetical protein